MPAMKEGKLLGFQLWINMPAKLKKNKPEYLYIKGNQLGTYKDNDKIIKVIAGKYENAENRIPLVNLVKISKFLKKPLSFFIDDWVYEEQIIAKQFNDAYTKEYEKLQENK